MVTGPASAAREIPFTAKRPTIDASLCSTCLRVKVDEDIFSHGSLCIVSPPLVFPGSSGYTTKGKAALPSSPTNKCPSSRRQQLQGNRHLAPIFQSPLHHPTKNDWQNTAATSARFASKRHTF